MNARQKKTRRGSFRKKNRAINCPEEASQHGKFAAWKKWLKSEVYTYIKQSENKVAANLHISLKTLTYLFPVSKTSCKYCVYGGICFIF